MAPYLPTSWLGEALQSVFQISTDYIRRAALEYLLPYLPESLIPEVLAAVMAIQEEQSKAWALARLAPRSPTALAEALKLYPKVYDAYSRIRLILELVPHVRTDLKENVIDAALAAAQRLQPAPRSWWLSAVARLVPIRLGGKELRERVQWAASSANQILQWRKADAWISLVPHLANYKRNRGLRQAMTASLAIQDPADRAEMLARTGAISGPQPAGSALADRLFQRREKLRKVGSNRKRF